LKPLNCFYTFIEQVILKCRGIYDTRNICHEECMAREILARGQTPRGSFFPLSSHILFTSMLSTSTLSAGKVSDVSQSGANQIPSRLSQRYFYFTIIYIVLFFVRSPARSESPSRPRSESPPRPRSESPPRPRSRHRSPSISQRRYPCGCPIRCVGSEAEMSYLFCLFRSLSPVRNRRRSISRSPSPVRRQRRYPCGCPIRWVGSEAEMSYLFCLFRSISPVRNRRRSGMEHGPLMLMRMIGMMLNQTE
jgi:hypothetical protein